MYVYAASSPIGGLDPTGLDFWIVYHPVVGSLAQHASIWWQPTGPFDANGPRITFGAGPEHFAGSLADPSGFFGFAGDVVGTVNRPRDFFEDKTILRKLQLPEGVCDIEMLRRMFELTLDFQNGPGTPYTALPNGPFDYNSNSYARGIAEAAGFTNVPSAPPAGVSLPGWQNPVQALYFGGAF